MATIQEKELEQVKELTREVQKCKYYADKLHESLQKLKDFNLDIESR